MKRRRSQSSSSSQGSLHVTGVVPQSGAVYPSFVKEFQTVAGCEREFEALDIAYKLEPMHVARPLCMCKDVRRKSLFVAENVGWTLKDTTMGPQASLYRQLFRPPALQSSRACCNAFADLMAALAGLHAGRVYHQDLKLGNVCCHPKDPKLVFIDFGTCSRIEPGRVTHLAERHLDGTGFALASYPPELFTHRDSITPDLARLYRAPAPAAADEDARGLTLEHRAAAFDVYALCMVFVQVLTALQFASDGHPVGQRCLRWVADNVLCALPSQRPSAAHVSRALMERLGSSAGGGGAGGGAGGVRSSLWKVGNGRRFPPL
jgi:serine/threonine protein kinase